MEMISNILQLLTAFMALLAALGTIWNARKLKEATAKVTETHATVTLLETNTNSIKDALIATTQKASFDAGRIDQASQPDPSIVKPK